MKKVLSNFSTFFNHSVVQQPATDHRQAGTRRTPSGKREPSGPQLPMIGRRLCNNRIARPMARRRIRHSHVICQVPWHRHGESRHGNLIPPTRGERRRRCRRRSLKDCPRVLTMECAGNALSNLQRNSSRIVIVAGCQDTYVL